MTKEEILGMMENVFENTERAEFLSIQRLQSLYNRLSEEDQKIMQIILSEWMTGEDGGKAYDALVTTVELGLVELRPTLMSLLEKAKKRTDIHAQYEISKLVRAIESLTGS